jgi:hypothetical protein
MESVAARSMDGLSLLIVAYVAAFVIFDGQFTEIQTFFCRA